jgi:drug/metabolite transporter (DMT)-like permease
MAAVGTLRTTGLTFGIMSAVCFGASGPCAKALTDAGFSPLQAVWIRVLGAAVLLVPAAVATRGRGFARSVRDNWGPMAAYAVTAVALCQTFYFVAASRLQVGVAILLEFTGPVLVVAWIGLVRRHKVPRSAVIGVLTAVLGLLAVVQIWSGLRLDPVGVAAGLGAACGNASYFLIVDRLAGRVDPLTLTGGGMTLAVLALFPLARPWRLPWHLFAAPVQVGRHSAPGWTIVAVLVLVSTVIAYVAGAGAVQRLSAPVACGVAYIEAVAASVIAWVTLGQRLTAVQICGGVVVLCGAFLAQGSVAEQDETPDAGDEKREVLEAGVLATGGLATRR